MKKIVWFSIISLMILTGCSNSTSNNADKENKNTVAYSNDMNTECEEVEIFNIDFNDKDVIPTLSAQVVTQQGYYILNGSDSRYISKSELYGLDAATCRLARNEIYARHGRMFNDASLQNYFNAQSWYTPRIAPDKFSESVLNKFERANIDLIVSYEAELKNKNASLTSQVPSWEVYAAGEYANNGLTFSVNIYTSGDPIEVGVIYTNDNGDNAGYMYKVGTNIYDIVGGTLNGSRIGITQSSMIVTNGNVNGVYPKTRTYSAP